jgi:RHS repeat-associated protein
VPAHFSKNEKWGTLVFVSCEHRLPALYLRFGEGGHTPNGALSVLSGVPGRNSWTFGVDGEGRPNSAVDGITTKINLVTATAYNAASQPTNVSLGSGDSDTYTYDSNTGRMATYAYNIGSTPKLVTGTLGWNQNWSLGSLLIADAFNKPNAQNCGYSHDDLARLQSVSCGPTNQDGTTWGQTFSYDAFGNITKSVPGSMAGIAWQPGYNANNQYTLAGTSYDGNGNLTADTFNTYAWDAYGNTVGINLGGSAPITITYDAFDRAVEVNNSGTYKQILYSPIGKLALMSKQNTLNVFVPLPGGEQATYTGSTIRFRHYDWLGSARFESNMAEAEYGDGAYAPFGETYSIGKTPYLSFTGQQQDTITGLNDFPYREYSPVQGRWISPDRAGLAAVDPNNPQSWNRYAYVLNNPLRYVDPLGLYCFYGGEGDTPENDSDPTDFDFSMASGGTGMPDCASSGGRWIDTTEIVNANYCPPASNCSAPDGNGFTLGVLAPGQTFRQCMAANVNNYSMGGAAELTVNVATGTSTSISANPAVSLFTGNGVSGLMFGDSQDAAQAGVSSAPDLVRAGIGTVTTYGRNSTGIMALNIARIGGAPQALSSSTRGLKSLLGSASNVLSLGMKAGTRWALDGTLTAAEAIGCSIPRGY